MSDSNVGKVESLDESYRELFAFWREERRRSLQDLNEQIEIAKRNSMMKNRPVNERMRWMLLIGRLTSYKDHVLHHQENEHVHEKLLELENYVKRDDEEEDETKTRQTSY